MNFLKEHNFTPITFKEYYEFKIGIKDKKIFPAKPIFLTFDDAYLDNYENAFPLLKKFGYKIVIFALGDDSITYNIWDVKTGEDKACIMNTAQKKEMLKYGIEFGAHTLTHPDLTQIPQEKAEYEIIASKKNLEEQLNTSIISFSYPFGRSNDTIRNIVKNADFKFGVSTDSGGMKMEDDNFNIFRTSIFPNDEKLQLLKKTSIFYRQYFKFKRKK